MIFCFLKYVKPIWYFNLRRKSGDFIFPILKENTKDKYGYETQLAEQYDFSYDFVINGGIHEGNFFKSFEKLSVYDNYVFIGK